jgi:lipoprotein NlpI
MAALEPRLDATHWRRGIARFCAGRWAEAAKQFESYHATDDVDRENGIWRYFSQWKADGREKARAGLLKYEKDDREPFPALYAFFQGKTTAADVLAAIEKAPLDDRARPSRLFYAHLYIGLDHAVAGRDEEARQHLRQATANEWPRTAGYGPNYMWHVGRLEYERLAPK